MENNTTAGSNASEFDDDPVSEGLPFIILAGMFFSFFYVIMIAIHVFCIKKWSTLVALELNELGDFLAGTFAPLAFAWLVIAVFVQKRELHAQLAEYQRSVKIAERQTRNLEKQYAHSMLIADKQKIVSSFTLIAAECQSISSIIPNQNPKILSKFAADNFEGTIKCFEEQLSAFNESQGGLSASWSELPSDIINKSDSLKHHLGIVSYTIDEINLWQKIHLDENGDNEIRAMQISSNLPYLKINAQILLQHLPS